MDSLWTRGVLHAGLWSESRLSGSAPGPTTERDDTARAATRPRETSSTFNVARLGRLEVTTCHACPVRDACLVDALSWPA